MNLPVRDYLYLDSSKLHDYMTSIDPGALQMLKSTTRLETADTENTEPSFGNPPPGERSQVDEARQERTLAVSDRHLFARFYDELKNDIPAFDEFTAINMDAVNRNSLIEVTRPFERSPLSEMIDSLVEVAEMMRSMGAAEQQEQARNMMHMMAFLMRDSCSPEDKSYPMISEQFDGTTRVLFIAQRKSILRSVDEFQGEMTMIGKVTKKVPAGHSIDLFDLLNLFSRSLRRTKTGAKSLKDVIVDMFST